VFHFAFISRVFDHAAKHIQLVSCMRREGISLQVKAIFDATKLPS